jgi:uncharacterized protein YhaN
MLEKEASMVKTIDEREDATHRAVMIDPLDQTIDILTARIATLEEKIAQLEKGE